MRRAVSVLGLVVAGVFTVGLLGLAVSTGERVFCGAVAAVGAGLWLALRR